MAGQQMAVMQSARYRPVVEGGIEAGLAWQEVVCAHQPVCLPPYGALQAGRQQQKVMPQVLPNSMVFLPSR